MAIEASKNFQVSATGGAGTSGQPVNYVAGIDRAQDFMELQSSAKMNKSGVSLPKGRSGGAPVMDLDEPKRVLLNELKGTDPNAVTAGAAMDATTPGPEVLASTAGLAAQSNEDIAKLAVLLPIYARIAEMPGASNATRNYYRWLRTQVTTAV
jgi:hypothetical protein